MGKRALLTEILIWTLALTVVFCGIIFTYSKIFVEPNIYTIKFKDIDGITKGSPVRFMGINVGYVRTLSSVDKSIKVQILITKKDIKIPNGTTARVEFYGLGGSKSIELMPPTEDTYDGIVTTDNIRIGDVVSKVKNLVDVIEIIERFVKTLDRNAMQGFLEDVKDTNPSTIEKAGREFSEIEKSITKKVEEVRQKQVDMTSTIKNANDIVLKFNKFIKK